MRLLPLLLLLALPVGATEATKTVLVDTVQHHDNGVSYTLACKITAPGIYRVASHASAELLQILPVGRMVKKGDLVAKQDDVYLTRQIAIIKTDMESAKVAKRYADDEYQRMQRLTKSGMTAASELNNLKLQVDSSELKIQRLQQELELAQARANRLNHFAPFDAQVMTVNAEQGSQLVEGQPILQLLSVQNKQLECLLPIINYRGPDELQKNRFNLENTPLTLRETSQSLDTRGENLTLYFDHPAKDKRNLLVGQPQQITMRVYSEQITRVPNDAIELDGKNYRVWRVNDQDMAERIDLRILDSQDTFYIVESGLRPGDKVVVRGQHGLLPGQSVAAELRVNSHRSGGQYE